MNSIVKLANQSQTPELINTLYTIKLDVEHSDKSTRGWMTIQKEWSPLKFWISELYNYNQTKKYAKSAAASAKPNLS